jgi:tRNA(adenine34) deaminase
MCTGAIIWARIGRLVYGARDPKAGAVFSRSEGNLSGAFNHAVPVVEGILEDKCREVIREFFVRRRAQTGMPA